MVARLDEISAKYFRHHKVQCDGTVDVVFTYVNGSDQTYQYSKYQHSIWWASRDSDKRKAFSAQRVRDNDELRHSLRSIFLYAPWVRKIFIVTNTPPSWLDTAHDRIQVVNDQDLFRTFTKAYPSFNSHAFEASIHAIPDLHECYLYMCDDYFLSKNISLDDFFDEERQLFKVYQERDRVTIPSTDKKTKPPNAHDASFRNVNVVRTAGEEPLSCIMFPL